MTQTSVFAFHSGHVSLTDNLITCWNKPWIDWITITDSEVATPPAHQRPQWAKRFSTMVSHNPPENSCSKVVYGCPNPDFVAFVANKRF